MSDINKIQLQERQIFVVMINKIFSLVKQFPNFIKKTLFLRRIQIIC